MTKAVRTTRACWHCFSRSSADLMARTHTHLNTERRAQAKLYLQGCGRLERQAHYAVQDILYHRLTFIMLNLPQTPRRPTCAANAKRLPAFHCQSHVCRQRLMGVERRVTALPCIKETCCRKVQEKRCLHRDALTTCHRDPPPPPPPPGSGRGEICWSVPLPGVHTCK